MDVLQVIANVSLYERGRNDYSPYRNGGNQWCFFLAPTEPAKRIGRSLIDRTAGPRTPYT
jgi:hypothetical protein